MPHGDICVNTAVRLPRGAEGKLEPTADTEKVVEHTTKTMAERTSIRPGEAVAPVAVGIQLVEHVLHDTMNTTTMLLLSEPREVEDTDLLKGPYFPHGP